MLQEFGPELWLCDGPVVVAAAGFHFPTRMAVIRLPSGGLLIWSPVALSDPLLDEVQKLGPVQHLVAPNKLHNLFLAEWKAAFPQAQLHAAPGLRERCPHVAFDADLADVPHRDWAEVLDQIILHNRIADEVVFFHRPSGTVLFADLLQGLPKGWFKGWRALVAKADRMTATEPGVPRKFRLGFRDRAGLRDGMARIQGWQVLQVVMAHGTPVTTDAAAFLTRAFAWADR